MSDWKTTRHALTVCPSCGKRVNAAGDPDGRNEPGPGDVSLCIGCAAINVYREDMTLETATSEHLSQLDDATMQKLNTYRAAIRSLPTKPMTP